jgi:hypothetical protein
MIKICPICYKKFTTTNNKKIYCGDECPMLIKEEYYILKLKN